jgi:S-phase kinase-associated protein 1
MAAAEAIKGLDEVADDAQLTLKGEDGSQTKVNAKAAMLSGFFQGTLSQDASTREIELKLDGKVIKKVVEYLEYRSKVPPRPVPAPLPTNEFKAHVDEWDFNFTNVDLELLLPCILAANYLRIQPMLELCCAKLASYIKGKTPAEIMATFKIAPPTPEEKENAKKLFDELFPEEKAQQ